MITRPTEINDKDKEAKERELAAMEKLIILKRLLKEPANASLFRAASVSLSAHCG